MREPRNRCRRLFYASMCGGLAIATLAFAASAVAAEEPTIFEMGMAMHANGVTIGPDGNLWFAATSSASSEDPGAVGRLDPDGKVVEFGLGEKSGARAIVSGPDGNLWFTEPRVGRVGRITPGGAITTFPLPDPASQPSVIAAGPDGNLWFTEFAGARIGRLTPAGAVTEFPLRAGSGPAGIAAGPDGNLWFTERGANRIGRITPAGEVTEFPLAGADPRPEAIIRGPDGNLWFSFAGSNSLGRITPGGAIARFPVPTLGGTAAIAAGPDGNLWFSSYGRIGALAPDGRLALLSCLKTGCRLPALALTAGPGGQMYAGTSTEYPSYGGGGTYININLTQRGYLASFTPRGTVTELTTGARPVWHRRTRLQLTCGSSGGCRGVLRLTRQRPVFPGETGGNGIVPVGRGRYDLGFGESASVLVGLNRTSAKMLMKRPLTAWALAEVEGGDLETARLVRLRRR